MKNLIIFLILLVVTLFAPTPYLRTTTTCSSDSCVEEQSFGWGDSLYKIILKALGQSPS